VERKARKARKEKAFLLGSSSTREKARNKLQRTVCFAAFAGFAF
jgi:hypothetical protein